VQKATAGAPGIGTADAYRWSHMITVTSIQPALRQPATAHAPQGPQAEGPAARAAGVACETRRQPAIHPTAPALQGATRRAGLGDITRGLGKGAQEGGPAASIDFAGERIPGNEWRLAGKGAFECSGRQPGFLVLPRWGILSCPMRVEVSTSGRTRGVIKVR